MRGYHLRRTFGMTTEEEGKLLVAQGGLCAICGRPPVDRVLGIDHDHQTGNIRGFLCSGCNRGLGFFYDDPKRLHAAAEYLEKWKGADNVRQ